MRNEKKLAQRKKRLHRFEKLENRWLLVGELLAVNLDVTQNGVSILDSNDSFQVDVGERFDLELRYDDLRSGFLREGAFGIEVDINFSGANPFRPVVTELKSIELSGEFDDVTGGDIVITRNDTLASVSIPFSELTNGFAEAAEPVIEDLLGLPVGSANATLDQSSSNPRLLVHFVGENLEFVNLPTLDVDASGLTGTVITAVSNEVDPGSPDAASVAFSIDAASSSLGGAEFYRPDLNGFQQTGPSVFSGLSGIGSFNESVASFADRQGLSFDGQNIEVLSIPMEAITEASEIQISLSPTENGSLVLYPDEIDPSTLFGSITANVGAAVSSAPFQNSVNRFDINGDGETTSALAILMDLNTLQQELAERNVSDSVTGKLPDNPTTPVQNFFDVNGDGFASIEDLEELMVSVNPESRDFGDAPFGYGTLLVDDGPRHLLSGQLRLGTSDGESDGVPSSQADGDDFAGQDDEDGVTFNSPFSRGASASIDVQASAVGKLDAWVDFNGNGDWSDVGERVFSGVDLSAGVNSLSIPVPVSANLGTTFARFRASTDGVDSPLGFAADGEVEDYAIEVSSSGGGNDIEVTAANGTSIERVDADLIIRNGSSVLASAAYESVGNAILTGTASDDQIVLNFGGGPIVPAVSLRVDGEGGDNTLVVSGDGASIDVTDSGKVRLLDFATIDLSDSASATIMLDAASVARLSPQSKTVLVVFQDNLNTTGVDVLNFSDAEDWRMTEPLMLDGEFTLTAANTITGESIRAQVPRIWQNVIDPNDVTNDGEVTAFDALRVINVIGRNEVSNPLDLTLTVAEWPGVYVDQDGDGRATALDALRIINHLARISPTSREQVVLPLYESPANRSADRNALSAYEAAEPLNMPSRDDSLAKFSNQTAPTPAPSSPLREAFSEDAIDEAMTELDFKIELLK